MSPSNTTVPDVDLGGDVAIPQLGFGVFQVPPEETVEVTTLAFDAGYRHIDTASAYGNEAEVGQAVSASGLDRDDVFITTKCWNNDHGYEKAKRALRDSLERLGLDFVDLYLIHWPAPKRDRYVETWRAFIELQQEGAARAIGVSNFQPEHLRRIVDETGVTPAANQIELHPRLPQAELRREHQNRGIVTEAWSPLAQGKVLGDPTLTEIAESYGRTTGQVVLRWHIQLGNVIFPKSVTPDRIKENFDVFDFHLADDDINAIEGLDAGKRLGPDPKRFA